MDKSEIYKTLMNCCRKGNIKQLEEMLRSGEIDRSQNYLKKALYYAVKSEKVEIVKILLNYGGNNYNDDGRPLCVACSQGYYDIAEILINSGADVNSDICDEGLHFAVAEKHVPIVKLLLSKGATLTKSEDLPSDYIKDIYSCYIEKTSAEIMKLLLDHRAVSLSLVSYYAIVKEEIPLLKLAISEGLGANSIITLPSYYDAKSTMLICACYKGKVKVIETLLKSGADPNLKDEDGIAPLMVAPDVSVIDMLLKFGADINVRDAGGNTALSYCDSEDNREVEFMVFLIGRGIDVDVKNHDNKTAREQFEADFDRVRLRWYDETMNEISKMKSIILNNYGLTLHNIMTMNRHELSRYVNNINLKEIFEDEQFHEKFPLLGRMLKDKFEKGEERKELMKRATQSLEDMLDLKIPELIENVLFKYFSDGEIKSAFLADFK